jgi:hypothetical protein
LKNSSGKSALMRRFVYIRDMAKEKKAKKSNRPTKYDEKLAVTGSFKDLMKAAVKDANKKSAPKKS